MNSLIIFLIIFSIIYYIYYPLFNKADFDVINNDGQNKSKEIYKQNLLNQIKELDFEKEMGTISESDYKFSKNSLLIEISKLIDK